MILTFFFDAGSGHVLWPSTAYGVERLGYPADLARIPIDDDLRVELSRLATWYDTSLNWEYPPDPGPWREAECTAFNAAVGAALSRLRADLGPGWTVVNEFHELVEDPDLDRYLADPQGFRR